LHPSAHVVVRVIVAEQRSLDVRLLEAPRFAVAGSTHRAIFLVSNLGNTDARLKLRTRSALPVPLTVTPSSLLLPASAADTVQVSATTDGSATESLQHSMELIAEDEADPSSTARASCVVEIIPAPREPEVRYHTLPLQVRLRTAGERSRAGTQGEIIGAGSFTEYYTDRISFLVRGPDLQPYSPLGPRDEYHLTYERGGLNVVLGDHPYALSPLTELGRYGLGGSVSYRSDPITTGAYYHRTRWVLPVQQQQAAYLRYGLSSVTSLETNYLGKREVTPADVLSLRALSEVVADTHLDAEYGRDLHRSTDNQGLSLRVKGRRQDVAYDVRYVRAERSFYGYYRDIDHLSAAATVTPWTNIRLEGQYLNEQRNLSRDPSLFSAPHSCLWLVGAGYGPYAALFYRHVRQNDALPAQTYDRTQQTLQLWLGYPLSSASVFANFDFGQTHDRQGNINAPFRRYSLYGSYRLSSRANIGASLEYSSEQGAVLAQVQDRYSASINAWTLVGRATQISLNLFASRSVALTRIDYGLADLTVEHVFPFGHTVLGRIRHTAYSPSYATRETAFLLEYGIPLAVPVRRITSTGELRGSIRDLETRTGVAGVLIKAGRFSSLTDNAGSFLLGSLPPGTYYATLDRQSIGLAKVPLQPVPMEVKIIGGETTRLDVDILRSASVHGTARLFEFAESATLDTTTPPLREAGTLPNVLVELANGQMTIRRITDNRGRFVIDDIVPGEWTLTIRPTQLPPYHAVEEPRSTILLQPGERREVTVRILPRRRRVRIVEEARLEEAPAVREPRLDRRVPSVGSVDIVRPAPARRLQAEIVRHRIPPGYALSVLAVNSEKQAVREAARLQRETGFLAFVQRLERAGTVRYSVRLGIFTTRAEAEQARDDLASRPLAASYGIIRADQPAPPYNVQSSWWSSEDEARREAAVLNRLGYAATVEWKDVPGIGRRFCVRIGPFATLAEVNEAQLNLSSPIRRRQPAAPDLPPR
jgi:cell division septation protein DedD